MEENNVFHLAKILQNTDSARNELQTFLQAMQTRVEQDYLQKIQAAAALQQADAVEHPPREVTLLRALGAFTDEAGKRRLDEACRSLMLFHTMGQIGKTWHTRWRKAMSLLFVTVQEKQAALPLPKRYAWQGC